ncbi:MAG: division/cell wall cluster transcriptional repressor MraZ [Patescibacteria group bacterium]
MLVGKFYHRLEEKGRVSLPKKFREQAKDWIVTRGLDGCLFMFKQTEFQTQIQDLSQRTFTKKAHRDLMRLLTNEAEEISADELGRVKLPNYLIEYAGISKEIVIVGSLRYLEIWDQDKYHHYVDQLENQAETIAESIIDV